MNKPKVIILGSSGHAKVIIDIFEKEKKYEILGLLDPNRKVGEETLGYKIIGKDEDLPKLIANEPKTYVFIAIADNWIRKKLVDMILNMLPDVDFATAIHPSAQIGKNVSIGKGTAIMAGAIINSDSQIGNFTIINTKASIDHDCKMMNFSSVAPGVTLGGNVIIGEYSAISIGATVKHGITIGSHSVIGAGSLLLKDCGNNLIAYGIPAQEIRKREIGEKYL